MLCAGGSRSSNASILTRLHALAEAEQQLQQHTAALHQAQAALHAMAAAAASHNRYAQPLWSQSTQCCHVSILKLDYGSFRLRGPQDAMHPNACDVVVEHSQMACRLIACVGGPHEAWLAW